MTSTLVLRLRMLVAEYGTTAVRVLAVLAVLSAAGGVYAAATTEETTTTRTTDVETVGAGLTHAAVVTGEDAVWKRGTVLRNRSTYFMDASPTVDLTARATLPGDGSVTVDQRLTMTVRANRDGETFYREQEVLAQRSGTVTGETAALTASVNVSALRARLADLRAEFDGVGDLSVRLTHRLTYDTGTYTGNLTAATPLEIRRSAFWVGGTPRDERRHSMTATRTVSERDLATPLSLMGLAAMAGASALVVRRYDRDDLDRDDLLQELHAARMSEWISEGEVPVWVGEQHIRLDSLLDVVDIGIDNEKRAIHDGRRDLYAVIDGSVVYYYCEDSSWHEMPWPTIGDEEGVPPVGGPSPGSGGPGPGPGGPGPGGPGDEEFGFTEFGDDGGNAARGETDGGRPSDDEA